jgi:hypothetical protein
MAVGLSPFNRALAKIPRRAEHRDTPVLRETFVDSGVAEVLDMVDHTQFHDPQAPPSPARGD